MRRAVVYVFGVPSASRMKVGFSCAPSVRGQTLRNQESMPTARLLFALPCSSPEEARRIETLSHRSLSAHHIEREWFAVDAEAAIDAIEAAALHEPDACLTMPRGTKLRSSLGAKAAWVTRRARYGATGTKPRDAA